MLFLGGPPNFRNSMFIWRHSVGKAAVHCLGYSVSHLHVLALCPQRKLTSYSSFAHVCSSLSLIYLMHPPLHIHKHPHCKKVRTCSRNLGAYASPDLRSKRVVTAADRGVERLPPRPLCCQVLGALQRSETCSRRVFPPRKDNKEVSSCTTCGFGSQDSLSRHNKHRQT